MDITFKQHCILLAGLTMLYDHAKDVGNSKMQHEIIELSDIIQEYAEKLKP